MQTPEFKIGDEVIVYDVLSMNHECNGVVSDILDNGIYKVTFSDGSSYHDASDLTKI